MKVKTLIAFNDLKAGKLREVGETFEVDSERFAEIIKAHKEPLVAKVSTRKRKAAKAEEAEKPAED